MGERINKITKRVKRLFGSKEQEKAPKKLSASQIIKPEEVIPEHGKRAPKSTTRITRRGAVEETSESGLIFAELPGGVTHVRFPCSLPELPVDDDTVAMRDPVTRRLSRKKLKDGMKKTTGYYDGRGRLISDTDARW